jgi:glycerophosphoryl diester phosphodiesterase
MLLIGHRGCHYPGYNQNTIRAFAKVTDEGVPAIEFDVQLCADGQLVVIHNLNLEEVSTGKGEVSSTDSKTLKSLYAGDTAQGEDRIPFLTEVLDFFASQAAEARPAIHLELKGENTGKKTGELINDYVASAKLHHADFLISSFNWEELKKIRSVCPTIQIALLDGAIRRRELLQQAGPESECYFERVFAYGREQYMIPHYSTLAENLQLLERECPDSRLRSFLANEIERCLSGQYYTDELLQTACEMNAVSVNLWYRTVTSQFVDRAHQKGLKVLLYTVNAPDELREVVEMGVDGVFTDYYSDSVRLLEGLII